MRFRKQLGGAAFKLNEPIVETMVGEHERTWYENPANGGEKYWWSATNAQQAIARRVGLSVPDKRWMVVGEVSAEGRPQRTPPSRLHPMQQPKPAMVHLPLVQAA